MSSARSKGKREKKIATLTRSALTTRKLSNIPGWTRCFKASGKSFHELKGEFFEFWQAKRIEAQEILSVRTGRKGAKKNVNGEGNEQIAYMNTLTGGISPMVAKGDSVFFT
jgi:hypothetical protein